MEPKTTDYCLLYAVDSVEDFLKVHFNSSSNKLKKHFKKNFLTRSFKEKTTLSLPLNFVNDGEINPAYIGTPLEILDEDENFLVFHKNPNQFIHPLSYDEGDNCLSYLRQIRPELLKVNRGAYDRGLLYRLDFETSGLVIYVKEENLYHTLRQNFSTIAKDKTYHAWVEGEMKLTGSFKHSFSSGEEKGRRVKVGNVGEFEQVGELSVTPIRYDSQINRTMVRVILKTGLRHQIRAQLAFLGYPLSGDKFYGGKEALRLYLHAYSYQLEVEGKNYFWAAEPINFSGI